MRSRHRYFGFGLALLFVGVQYGAQLHALGHIGEQLKHTPDHSLTVPGDEVCAMCALFAGGCSALAGATNPAFVAPDKLAIGSLPPMALAAAAPAYYFSRAPPSLL